MTKQELITKLKEISDKLSNDSEYYEYPAHIDADALLLEFIDDNEVKKAFEDIPKWYA